MAQAGKRVVDRAGSGTYRERIDSLGSQGQEAVAIRRAREKASRARSRKLNPSKSPRSLARQSPNREDSQGEEDRAGCRRAKAVSSLAAAFVQRAGCAAAENRADPIRGLLRPGIRRGARCARADCAALSGPPRHAACGWRRAGRLDFRRTIRASIQRGGALSDLRFRARRPRHIDLVILADISGSVRYSSTLMLELIAGAANFFRRVRSFVFIDRLAEAEFEQKHLVMTPPLDLYARSDFGRVLGELWERRGELLNRATVLVIMGDGRNNRRPARADLLREMGRHVPRRHLADSRGARAMGYRRQRDFSIRARGFRAGAVARSARTRRARC